MPWETLVISVVMFIPVIVAQAWRRALLHRGPDALAQTLRRLQPVSLSRPTMGAKANTIMVSLSVT